MVGSAALQHRFFSSFVGDRFLHPSQPFHQLFRYHPDVYLGKEVIKMYCSLPRYNKCKHLLNLSYLLRLSTISRALAQGMQVHQQIIQQGLDVNPFFVTKLLQFYAHLDHLRYAQKLFDKLSQPNVFAWTAVLAFQSRNGMFSECLQVYGEMRSKGVIPDEYVFPKVIRACAQLSCLDVGTSIHKEVIIYGLELSLQVCNPLIDMYSKCKDVGSARQIFDDMEKRDLFSWNSIISGYVSNAFSMLAVELVNFMRLEGVEPDVVTRNAVMDAYCQIGMCAEALKVFAQIEEPNIISWTTLISGFSRNGKHETSLGIFRDMMNSGVVIPDVDSLSRTLVSCRHLGALRNGQEVHGYGIKFLGRCIFYSSAGPALLTMYSRCGRIHTASEVFELMDKFDAIAWNAMIVAFVDLEMRHSALECFMEMQIMGIKNDKTTISTALPICELKLGKEIHAYVVRNSYDSDVSVLNALIWMYSKCGCLKTAQLVFSNMVTRDLVSWNTIVGSLAMHGQGQAALRCVQEMNSLGLSVDAVTLTSALSACSHSGLVDEGLELFHSMSRDFGLIPQIEHFACLVDMLARAGQLDEAVALLNQMPIKPDKHIWGTLLIASEAQRNVKFAQLAVENLLQLEPEKAGYYVTLSNLYARGGRWDDAISIRKRMESRGLVKPVGTSWIEYEN